MLITIQNIIWQSIIAQFVPRTYKTQYKPRIKEISYFERRHLYYRTFMQGCVNPYRIDPNIWRHDCTGGD